MLNGTIAVILGISVYYGLPLALLKFNIGLILVIFFVLLLAMLLGLVILSINLQSALEKALMYILLFWEKKSMRIVLAKNLVTHKKKNRLTAVIYALSLGSLIFLLTSANLQISFIVGTVTLADADINVEDESGVNLQDSNEKTFQASQVDHVIRDYLDYIDDWAYHTETIEDALSIGYDDIRIGDLARLANDTIFLRAVTPSSMFDNTIEADYRDPETKLGLTE